jgi:hypothetical protein
MADQITILVNDANGVQRPIACVPLAVWGGVDNAYAQAGVILPWNYTIVTASGTTVVKNAAGTLAAIINLDAAEAQVATIIAYDNATTNSGNIVANTATLANKIDWPPGGIAMANGIVIHCSSAPTSNGILILWL